MGEDIYFRSAQIVVFFWLRVYFLAADVLIIVDLLFRVHYYVNTCVCFSGVVFVITANSGQVLFNLHRCC